MIPNIDGVCLDCVEGDILNLKEDNLQLNQELRQTKQCVMDRVKAVEKLILALVKFLNKRYPGGESDRYRDALYSVRQKLDVAQRHPATYQDNLLRIDSFIAGVLQVGVTGSLKGDYE